MGFFDSLWEGVKEGGKFVIENAGDIIKAGAQIGKVAGLFRGRENEVNIMAQSDIVLKIFDDYHNATKVLEDEARASRKTIHDEGVVMAMDDPQSALVNVSGTWLNPTAITGDNKHRVKDMDTYQDISKLLSLAGAPEIVLHKRKALDVAQMMTEALFANAEAPKSSTEALDDGPLKRPLTFILPTKEVVIKAAHSYYDIPMGDTTPKRTWHGAIDVSVTRPRQAIMDAISQRKPTTFVAEVQATGNGPAWSVGLDVVWGHRGSAENGVDGTAEQISKNYRDWTLSANSSTGRTQIVRLQTPPGKTPADARNLLAEIVRKIMNSDSKGDSELKDAMPQIDVTTATIV